MSRSTARDRVDELIREYECWELAKSYILKTYNEIDKAMLITVRTEMMINRLRTITRVNLGS